MLRPHPVALACFKHVLDVVATVITAALEVCEVNHVLAVMRQPAEHNSARRLHAVAIHDVGTFDCLVGLHCRKQLGIGKFHVSSFRVDNMNIDRSGLNVNWFKLNKYFSLKSFVTLQSDLKRLYSTQSMQSRVDANALTGRKRKAYECTLRRKRHTRRRVPLVCRTANIRSLPARTAA